MTWALLDLDHRQTLSAERVRVRDRLFMPLRRHTLLGVRYDDRHFGLHQSQTSGLAKVMLVWDYRDLRPTVHYTLFGGRYCGLVRALYTLWRAFDPFHDRMLKVVAKRELCVVDALVHWLPQNPL